jgi:type III secretion protein T
MTSHVLTYDELKSSLVMLGVVQARLMPIFVLLPFMNRNMVPRVVSFSVAAGLGLLLLPVLPNSSEVQMDMVFVMLLVKEAFIGLLLGFACALPFWAMEAVGFVIDNQRGASMAASVNPLTGNDTSPMGILLNYAFIAFFFVAGGFQLMLGMIYDSYKLWPPMSFLPQLDIASANLLLMQLNRMVLTTLLLASPILLIMFMAEIGLALISRFAPQLQVFFMAMPIKSALGLFVLVLYTNTLFDYGGQYIKDLPSWTRNLNDMLGGGR